MILTDEKITVTMLMMNNANMTRGGSVGVPINPKDKNKGLIWKDIMRLEDDDFDKIEEYFLLKPVIMQGKCPKDNRENRPIFITVNNERTLAISDGKGHAYKMYGNDYMQLKSKCLPENKYSPNEYEFDRGLSGFDF